MIESLKSHWLTYLPLLLCFSILSSAQEFEDVDIIHQQRITVLDFKTNSSSERMYLLGRASGTISINDFDIEIPEADTSLSSPFFLGRTYLVVVDSLGSLKFFRHVEGDKLAMSSNSVAVVGAFTQDSLVISDTTFYHSQAGSERRVSNLFVLQYSFGGSLLFSKQFSESRDVSFNISDFEYTQDKFVVSCNYTTRTFDAYFLSENVVLLFEELGLGSIILSMDSELRAINGLISGLSYETKIGYTDSTMLIGGNSSRSYVRICDDTIKNDAIIVLNSNFFHLSNLENDLNCLHNSTIKYDIGSVFMNELQGMNNGTYICSGNFNSPWFELDGKRLEKAYQSNAGFVINVTDSLTAIHSKVITGCEGYSHLSSLAVDKNNFVYIGGLASCDSFAIGDFLLTSTGYYSNINYLLKLSNKLEILSAFNTSTDFVSQISSGKDGITYFVMDVEIGGHKVVKMKDSISHLSEFENLDKNSCFFISPNPISNGQEAHIDIVANCFDQLGDRLELFNMFGQKVKSIRLDSNQPLITLDNIIPGIYLAIVQLGDGSYASQKLVIN